MNYWDTGRDPVKDRYGLPAREHPDYKAKAARLSAISKELRRLADEVIYPAYMAAGLRLKDAGIDWRSDAYVAEFKRLDEWSGLVQGPLRAERRALLSEFDARLYRTHTGSPSVRFDRVGKYAWETELKRLGRK